jgi:hypothetical protein
MTLGSGADPQGLVIALDSRLLKVRSLAPMAVLPVGTRSQISDVDFAARTGRSLRIE